ncbi:hypothetical protein Droror1_Dr00017492 [Drosera rotundifolia]
MKRNVCTASSRTRKISHPGKKARNQIQTPPASQTPLDHLINPGRYSNLKPTATLLIAPIHLETPQTPYKHHCHHHPTSAMHLFLCITTISTPLTPPPNQLAKLNGEGRGYAKPAVEVV